MYLYMYIGYHFLSLVSFLDDDSSDTPSTSIMMATPARIHFLGGTLVFN